VSYPIQEKVGLLWMWPSSGVAAQQEATESHPVVTQGLEEHFKGGREVNWYMRDLPYGERERVGGGWMGWE
jgi:phenylpropionate dioxygenase-like ring-hydroxylating dioxygenase large terminal subunit